MHFELVSFIQKDKIEVKNCFFYTNSNNIVSVAKLLLTFLFHL